MGRLSKFLSKLNCTKVSNNATQLPSPKPVLQQPVNDESLLLAIFPEEIWDMILDSNRNPKILENCSNASQYFRNLLYPRRTTFLFPSVFQCLAPKYEQAKTECYDDLDDYDSDDEFIGQPADTPLDQKIWIYPGGIRLVCTTWNKIVDKYYPNHKSHYETYYEYEHLPNICRVNGYFSAERQQNLNKLITRLGSTHGSGRTGPRKNPSFQRSLFLNIDSTDIGNFERHVFNQALKVYGKEFWHLTITIINKHNTISEFYLRFKELLEYMPNVKVLRMTYHMLRSMNLPSELGLEETIMENPLPKLGNLKFIKNDYGLPNLIFMELLSKNSHVEMLKITFTPYKFYLVELTNLNELHYEINSKEIYLHLKQVGKAWKLKTFKCLFEYPESRTKQAMLDVFGMVTANWAETLEDLMLYFPRCTDYRVPKENHLNWTRKYRLKLPKLKRIQLNMPYYPIPDFLLGSANTLETVILHGWGHDADIYFREKDRKAECELGKSKQIIEFLGFETRMRDSNIWKFLKRLELVSVMHRNFHRPLI